jgi:hypothetical protein
MKKNENVNEMKKNEWRKIEWIELITQYLHSSPVKEG